MSISEAVAQVKNAADANDHQLANSLMKKLNWMTLSRDERRILNDIVMDAEAHARAAREFQERRAVNASSVGDRVVVPPATFEHLRNCVGGTCQATHSTRP